MKMKVADYLTQELAKASDNKIFMITGGMIMFLTDAVYKMHKNNNLDFYCFHHEQAASMAAEAYGRASGKLGVTYVTAGPAALNTLNSVVGAYVDRSPCIIVSGQSKVEQTKVTGPRQFALQGFNTLPIFEQVTKYAVILDDIAMVKYEIQKAIYLALQQPVGPVWIECPLDIQGSTFDPEEYDNFIQPIKNQKRYSDKDIQVIITELMKANRPVILAGAGIRQSKTIDALHILSKLLNIPLLTTRMGMDIIDNNDNCFVGKPGTYGDRTGNYTVQNSDALLVLGCRLSIGLIGHDYASFAINSKRIIVDVDTKEFDKPSIFDTDICIEANLQDLLPDLIEAIKKSNYDSSKYKQWLNITKKWQIKYPVDLEEYKGLEELNSYHFMGQFSKKVDKDALFAIDTGSCFHVHAQAFKVKYGQRHIITGGLSTMGYSPSSIGVAVSVSGTKKDIYCISGDGSIQMNIQEFQTISNYQLPIKTIIINNDGYLLIRHTQKNFCEGRMIGEGSTNGVGLPSMKKVADLYDIKYMSIKSTKELSLKLDELINHKGPLICEVFTPREQLLIPRVASKKLDDGKIISMPYDDMFPFLDKAEYEENKKMALECKN